MNMMLLGKRYVERSNLFNLVMLIYASFDPIEFVKIHIFF